METSDAELVARARAGEVDAFAELIQRHRESIAHLARSLVPSRDTAEDLVQETFVLAFQHLASLRDGSRFVVWLRQITLNTARQWGRREAQISLEPLWDEAGAIRPGTERSSDPTAERLRARVRDALRDLSPETRTAVLLHYFDGYDYGEAAALLDVPVSTVRGRLYLARRRLREEMAELAPAKNKTEKLEPEALVFPLTATDLAALRGAELLASRDPLRPVLQTLCIDPDGTIVATDTHRMFVHRGSSIRPPARLMVEYGLLSGLTYHPTAKEGQLTIDDRQAVLRFVDERDTPPEHTFQAPLVTEGSYPAYDKVIPADSKITARLLGRDLMMALDDISRFEAFLLATAMPESGQERRRVTLTFTGAGPVLFQVGAARSGPAPADWSMNIEIPATVQGLAESDRFTLALNRIYLRECVRALSLTWEAGVELRLNDPLHPVLVHEEGVTNRFILLMPLSLSAS
jgi:RNA polymerase sigma-70 factor (ECF subfamily)